MIFDRTVVVIFLGIIVLVSDASISPVIFDGEYANIVEYPHAAYLKIRLIPQKRIICGASILSQQILITAGHCVYKASKELSPKIFVTIGFSNVTDKPVYEVTDFKLHENYYKIKNLLAWNDIALLKVNKRMKFGKTVDKVIIKKSLPYGAARIAGWGVTDTNRTQTELLKQLNGLEVWPSKECIKHYKLEKYGFSDRIHKDHICAGYRSNRRGYAYSGDSGSGLIMQGNILIAVYSGRILGKVATYTAVEYHYDWIKKTERMLNQGNSKKDLFD